MKCYAVDIDGILCEVCHDIAIGDHIPILGNINTINRLYDQGHTIIVHTSRRENLRTETEQWLHTNNVKFQALVMNKLKADYYIDDRNLMIEEL